MADKRDGGRRMSTRWDVERAVAGSDLVPAARLIMYALASLADAKTCAVPAAHTPSLTRLERMTGLSRSSVTRCLNHLEAAGWVVRKRPATAAARGEGTRTKYRIAVPSSPTETLDSSPTETLDSPDCPGMSRVSVGLGSPTETLGVVPPWDQGSPTVGLVLDLDQKRISASGLEGLVTHATGASRDEAAAIIEIIRRERSPRNLAGFIRRVAADGDLDRYLAEHRAVARRADTETAWAAIKAGPECEHRMPGGAMPHPASGEPVCVACRAARRIQASGAVKP